MIKCFTFPFCFDAKNEREKSSDGNYFFEMKKPIPSYLIALAVGDLSYQSLGPNTGFYCEPELAKACLFEFQDLPKNDAS